MEIYQYVPSVVDLRVAINSLEVLIVVMYLGLHVKCLILNKFGVSRQIFVKVLSFKFHENPSSGSRADTCGQMDWRTDGRTDRRDEALRDLHERI
jgi:hypothetical protein